MPLGMGCAAPLHGEVVASPVHFHYFNRVLTDAIAPRVHFGGFFGGDRAGLAQFARLSQGVDVNVNHIVILHTLSMHENLALGNTQLVLDQILL